MIFRFSLRKEALNKSTRKREILKGKRFRELFPAVKRLNSRQSRIFDDMVYGFISCITHELIIDFVDLLTFILRTPVLN